MISLFPDCRPRAPLAASIFDKSSFRPDAFLALPAMTTCSTEFVSPGALLPAPSASTAETDSTWHRRKTVPFDPRLATPPRDEPSRQQSRIVTSVESALAAVEPFRRPIERRREARFPYPYPIHMTPYGQNGLPDAERSFVVIGKHLAPHGLDFYYGQPLAHRRVV